MAFVFAANVTSGQKVRRTTEHADGVRGWGDFKKVVDVLQRPKTVDLLTDDGRRLRNLAPIEVLEVAPSQVQP